ncbi:uncharacterized protein LOC121761819 [Salvia splendens]|uniref:uncharacterized protein LOC121761819 n=1 Tax=Salvia splendens TaxID=180675 RepID=UPI001C27DB79|nr:uncharacterized protein LOC121761819 [Salvia splendens]
MQTLLRVFLSLSIFSSSALPPLSLPERNFLGRDDTAMPWLLLYNLLMDNQFFNEGLCYECTKSSSMENVEEAADVQNVEEEAAGEKTTSVPAEREEPEAEVPLAATASTRILRLRDRIKPPSRLLS